MSLSELLTPKEQLSFSAELRQYIHARNILTSRSRQKVLSDLDDINLQNETSKRLSLRQQAIQEILSSEITYIQQLELVMNFFMKPLFESKIIPYDAYTSLFGSIESIYNVNRELLKEVKNNPENIASAFLTLAPFLKLYSLYAYDYKKSLLTLQEVQNKYPEFCKFLEQQESKPEVSNKLSALLITPIQRVPRYRLLLKQVLAYTLPSHDDYSTLLKSLKEVEQAAFHINSLVEEQENSQRLLELQRCLYNNKLNLIKPGRHLLKEGFVMKMLHTGVQNYKRYFILFSDIIMYCKLMKSKPTEPNSLKCCCILPLHKCQITEVANKGVFTITCQNEALIFYCESASEVESWITAIQTAVSEYVNCRKTLRKDSSSRKPARKHRILEFDQEMLSPGQPRKKRIRMPFKEFEEVYRMSDSDSDNSKKNIFNHKKKVNRKYKPKPTIISHKNPTKDVLYPMRNDFKPLSNLDECDEDVKENTLPEINYGLNIQVTGKDEGLFKRVHHFFSSIKSSLQNVFKIN